MRKYFGRGNINLPKIKKAEKEYKKAVWTNGKRKYKNVRRTYNSHGHVLYFYYILLWW